MESLITVVLVVLIVYFAWKYIKGQSEEAQKRQSGTRVGGGGKLSRDRPQPPDSIE